MSVPPAELAVLVKRRASELGFDACGVAAAGPVDPDDRLGEWLSQGFDADMAWLARTKEMRQDPRLWVAGARSVVVVARNYHASRPEAGAGCGKVSSYAWGRDYHRVLDKPIRALAKAISEAADGTECRCCVDTGPVLERAWAARAGVGWIGKNGLVLRRGLGSWFVLGVIVTTAELAADAPVQSRCGTCTRCMDACPTGALVAPGMVDSRRCISYHTIENRGEIPDVLADAMGRWVFGCDICQEACPWNRDCLTTSETDFHPRAGHASPPLDVLEEMGESRFREEFAGTPILRSKYEGFMRNLRIARRNIKRGVGARSSDWLLNEGE